MAKLKKCKECGADVSKKADKCPHCGAPLKRKPLGCGALIVVIVLAVIFTNSMQDSPSRTAEKDKPLPTKEVDKKQLEEKLLAELKGIPVSDFEQNLERYKKLVKMFPTNTSYQGKVQFYQKAADRHEQIQRQFSPWDGSHKGLERYIKKNLKNPDSYDHVQTVYGDKGDHLIIETTYRATNSFNAVVTEKAYAKVNVDGTGLTILTQ